jgi:hypothetical protein
MRYLAMGLLGFVLACAGNTGHGNSTDTEQDLEHKWCPSTYTLLTGTAGAGQPCSTFFDCYPTCCFCSSGGHSYGAASCVASKCADYMTTCANAATLAPLGYCTD